MAVSTHLIAPARLNAGWQQVLIRNRGVPDDSRQLRIAVREPRHPAKAGETVLAHFTGMPKLLAVKDFVKCQMN